MADFITSLTSGVEGIMTLLGKVTTGLLSNDLFAFGVAVAVAVVLIGIVSSLIRRGRRA